MLATMQVIFQWGSPAVPPALHIKAFRTSALQPCVSTYSGWRAQNGNAEGLWMAWERQHAVARVDVYE